MPGLRENLQVILERELNIDKEFAELIPPLTQDEYKGLERSILADGCREPIITWDNTIIDGHNRYKICTEHNVPFRTLKKEFKDRNSAVIWILQNQLSRRNLNDFQRIEMVRKCENAVKAQAKERQGTRTDLIKNKAKDTQDKDIKTTLPQGEKSRDTLGAMARVSGSTYDKAAKVMDKAPKPIVDAARRNELSINAAYQVIQMPKKQQLEISQRIENGEKPSQAVFDTKTTIPTAKNRVIINVQNETLEQLKVLSQAYGLKVGEMCLWLINTILQSSEIQKTLAKEKEKEKL